MPILHTLNKPASFSHLSDRLSNVISSEDSVILLEDGAYHALDLLNQQPSDWANLALNIYVLKDDAESRGITNIDPQLKVVDYHEFVTLTTSHDKVISWY